MDDMTIRKITNHAMERQFNKVTYVCATVLVLLFLYSVLRIDEPGVNNLNTAVTNRRHVMRIDEPDVNNANTSVTNRRHVMRTGEQDSYNSNSAVPEPDVNNSNTAVTNRRHVMRKGEQDSYNSNSAVPVIDNVLSNEEGNQWISEHFQRGGAFVAGRLSMGSELCLLTAFRNGHILDKTSCNGAHNNAGIYPETPEILRTYAEILSAALAQLNETDVMATFGLAAEVPILREMPTAVTKNRVLEPYYFGNPWSRHLKNKTVLIVHGFVPSIKCQLRRQSTLFSNPLVLPEFRPKFVHMPFAFGGRMPHGSYVETLEAVKTMIDNDGEFDVAIVSTGAYGMPLAVYCKTAHNATAIAMGGGAQVLFGLKGHRWDSRQVIRKLYNSH